MSTQKVLMKLSPEHAASVLINTKDLCMSDYEKILEGILQTGYNINNESGALLLSALSQGKEDVCRLLFAKGAQTACSQYIYQHTTIHHAYTRKYAQGITDMLLEHTMGSPFADVIIKSLQDFPLRMTIFDIASNDELRAQLYIRCNRLPGEHPNKNVLELCAKAGLEYPSAKKADPKLSELERVKKELAMCQHYLNVSQQAQANLVDKLKTSETETESLQEKLEKASLIIKTLSSI